MRYFAFILMAVSLISGCSTAASTINHPITGLYAGPDVAKKGDGSQWAQIVPKGVGSVQTAIVAGPDGNMWLIDESYGSLVRMSMSGADKVFHISGDGSGNSAAVKVTVL